MRKIAYIFISVVFLLTGCSVARKSSVLGENRKPSVNGVNTIENVIKKNLSYNSFLISKANISVNEEGFSGKFIASIKFKAPDSLLIAAKSKLGIEVGRLLLTKDTLFIIDRINKKLITGNPQALKRKFGLNRSVFFMILGDLVVDKTDAKRLMKCSNGSFSSDFVLGEQSINYQIDCKKNKITRAYLEGGIQSGNIEIKFNDIEETDNCSFPRSVVLLDDLSMLKVEIGIEKVDTGWNGKIEFNPDNGYKKVFLR